MIVRFFLALASAVLVSSGPLLAAEEAAPKEEESTPNFSESTLTGDWGGARTAAWKRGLAWEAGLKADVLQNRGGTTRGNQAMSHLELKFRADFEKLFGWSNAVAFVNINDDRGAGLNARRTGSLMGVSNIEVPVPTARLFHAWVQKGFFDDRFSILAGIYPIDSEFFTIDSAATLLHPAYGTPGDLALTRGPSVFNNAAFGVRTKWFSSDRTLYAMGALMDGIPNDPARPKATAVRFAKGDGGFFIAELGWMPLEQGHAFETTDPTAMRLPEDVTRHEQYEGISKYALGLWGYGSRVADLVDVDANGAALQRHSRGGYLLAERTLWNIGSEGGRNLTAFGRYSFADSDTISIDRTINLGMRILGPFASRPRDIVAVGWTRARLASKWRTQQAASGTDTVTAEDALEISWRAALTRWLAIQPNYQRIRHPGGTAAAPTATVVGARIEVTF
jgi:porin